MGQLSATQDRREFRLTLAERHIARTWSRLRAAVNSLGAVEATA
jgi:hypothetical protein